jgi:hypothetical protein
MMGSADNPGIIPRLCNALFDRIRRLKDEEPLLTCKVSAHPNVFLTLPLS